MICPWLNGQLRWSSVYNHSLNTEHIQTEGTVERKRE